MYKKVIILFIFVVISCSTIVYAENNSIPISQENKTSILILLTGSYNRGQSVDDDLYKDTTANFQKTFLPNYNLLIGTQYQKRLKDSGISDIDSLERSDLINAYKDVSPNYIIVYDILPVQTSGFFLLNTLTSYVHIKIIDVLANKYLYTGRFTYSNNMGSYAGDLRNIYLDIEKEVLLKNFPLITLDPKNK